MTTTAETTAEAPVVRTPLDESFLQSVLSPYVAKDCVYLKSAATAHGVASGQGASIRAAFHIPTSCYIDSTGHFNSVELNICYNQLYYVLIADGIRRAAIPEMREWSMKTFYERQLPGMLIARIASRFSRPIDATSFWAEGTIHKMVRRRAGALVFLETSAKFADEKGGSAEAECTFAFLHS